MVKIRKNVFETNSSSTHSIAIGNDLKYDVLDLEEPFFIKNEDGEYVINSDEVFSYCYSREFDILMSLSEKTAFLIAYGYKQNIIESVLKEIIPNFTKINIPKDDEAFMPNPETKNLEVESFLKDPNKILIIDSDESFYGEDFKKNNLFQNWIFNNKNI